MFDAAKAKGQRSGDNPAAMKGNLDTLLPQRPTLQRGHHPAIPFGSIFLLAPARRRQDATAALKLLILTATRTSQTTLARWSEFDLDAAMPVWTIPPRATSSRRRRTRPAVPHRGAADAGDARLAAQAEGEGVARRGPAVSPPRRWRPARPFPGCRGFAGYAVHGLRSTYRDWGTVETDFPADVLNAAYGHVVHNKVERAYAREKAIGEAPRRLQGVECLRDQRRTACSW